eukprot:jgi/Botrbrau1/15572/Bobra.33_1s0003.3
MLAGVLEPGSDLRTLAECEALLAKIPNAQSILAKANDAVDFAAAALNRVPPNLSRAAKAAVQLQSEVTGWVQDLSTLLADSAGTASGALGIALETTLLERIHDSLVRHVAAGYGEEDWRLHEGMLRLTQQCAQDEGGSRHAGSGRSMNAILALTGAEEPLRQADLSPASLILQGLDAARTPLDIVTCLRDADVALVDALSSLRAEGTAGGITSADDLLPLLIGAIILAHPRHLASALFYVSKFHFFADWKGQVGFQVASLEAAKVFVSQQLLPQVGPLSSPFASSNGSNNARGADDQEGLGSKESVDPTGTLRAFLDMDSVFG